MTSIKHGMLEVSCPLLIIFENYPGCEIVILNKHLNLQKPLNFELSETVKLKS